MERRAFILRIAPGRVDHVDEALREDCLIIGWAYAKGLLEQGLQWESFREIIHKEYHPNDETLRGAGAAAGNMWRFIHAMEKADLVVVPSGSGFYVGEVTGDAFYDESKVDEDTAYRRPVKWLSNKLPIPRAYATSALVARMKARQTCVDATDLVKDITFCLDRAKSGTKPSFETDLKRKLVEVTLQELQHGLMENYGFEELIKMVMLGLGARRAWKVPRREDRGIDIYATFLVAGAFEQRVGIQAKHFQPVPPVDAPVVAQLIRGIEEGTENVTLGMVITTGEFNDAAFDVAKSYEDQKGIPIELVDGKHFAGLIVEHGLAKLFSHNS